LKVILLRVFAPFLVLAMIGLPALAQLPPSPPSVTVSPQPSVAGELLEAFVTTGLPSCFYELTSSNVMLVGSQVIIDFEVATASGTPVCLPTPPLLTFESPIGELAEGQYELVLNRTLNGVVDDPVIIPFGVLPAAVSVPTGRWIVPALGLFLLFVGWRQLSGGRMRNY